MIDEPSPRAAARLPARDYASAISPHGSNGGMAGKQTASVDWNPNQRAYACFGFLQGEATEIRICALMWDEVCIRIRP